MVTLEQEKTLLERCLSECRRRLDTFRRDGNYLEADMAEADLNRMLEELAHLYDRIRGKA